VKETESVTVTKTVTHIICDCCGRETFLESQCGACGCDMCGGCRMALYYDIWTESDNGDHPDYVCNVCSCKLDAAGERVKNIHNEAEAKLNTIHDEWIRDCKAARREITKTKGDNDERLGGQS
jgi:ribosomal protein L37E